MGYGAEGMACVVALKYSICNDSPVLSSSAASVRRWMDMALRTSAIPAGNAAPKSQLTRGPRPWNWPRLRFDQDAKVEILRNILKSQSRP